MFIFPYGTTEHQSKRRFHWVTLGLVALNILVFAWEIWLVYTSGDSALERFFSDYAFVPASLQDGGVFPGLISSMFLHAGLLHIAGNMLFLLPFGDNVEDRLGHARYILFYLLCGVIATLTFAFFNQGSTTPLVGASGAIGGILGGYLALHPRGSQVKGIFFFFIIFFRVTLPASLFIGYWFIMQVFSSLASFGADAVAGQGGGVAFLAHVGGFLAGLVLAPLLALREPSLQSDT